MYDTEEHLDVEPGLHKSLLDRLERPVEWNSSFPFSRSELLSNVTNELLPILPDAPHQGRRGGGRGIVLGRPATDFNQDGKQVESLGSGVINELTPLAGSAGFGDEPLLLQTAQAFGEHISGYPLPRSEEFLVPGLPAKQNVPQYKKGPAVSEDVQREGDGAMRSRRFFHNRILHIALAKRKHCASMLAISKYWG